MAYGQNMDAPMSGLMGLAAMKGRMGDNTLVHVNPMELKALNAMAGPGGLTQNPSTGLPEAFKIKDLLPALLAVAAPFAVPVALGGAGLGAATTGGIGALAAGAGAATGTALTGGNREEILMSGLASGLTAGLTGGLDKAASGAVTTGVKEGAIGAGTANVGASGFGQQAGSKLIGDTSSKALTKTITDAGLTGTAKTAATQLGQEAFAQQALKRGAATGLAAAATSPAMFDVPAGPKDVAPPTTVPRTEMTQTASKEDIDRYIRQGGATPQFFNYSPAQIPAQFGGMAAEGGSMGNVPATYMAQGGDTGMFSGMVEAPQGDGMSDNVSFEVVGDPEIKQAMLSPDEYVMDAFTVAALGNGSSDAGAKQLDDFRLALREKVYGKEAQPKQVDGAKELSRLA